MWCPIGEGHADVKDSDSPQKLDLYFDTPTGKKFGRKPGWVLKTDYTRYYREFKLLFVPRRKSKGIIIMGSPVRQSGRAKTQ